MARRPRVVYSPEFRAEAIRRVRDTEEPIRHIARDLGISVGSLRGWIEAARPKPEVPLTDDERSELRRLRKEVRELRMEREILKNDRARRVPRYLLDQKLPGRLSSRHPGRSGRLLFGDAAANP